MDSPEVETKTANHQIARAAGTVMLAILMGQIFSLVSSILITRAFGTDMQSEAFYAANRLPDILYNLVAGGALASAFIPTFTGLLTKGERQKAWLIASSVANIITAVFVFVCGLAALFAPWIITHIVAPGFTDPQKLQLTVDLARIQLAAPIIFGLSGLAMGILNSHQSFLWPALAPAMYSIGKILGVLLLAPSMGVYGLAIGVVGGALMHGLIQLPSLLRLPQIKYTPTFGLHLADVREVARLMGPRLLGVAFVQLNLLVNSRLASLQPEGSVSAISYAFGLMLIPEAAIAQAIAIAALPTFSAQVAKGLLADMRSSLAATLRSVLLLAVPASLGLILLARPVVSFIFQRGVFDPNSTELVTWALVWYAAGLVGHSIVEIASRAFYALHDTKTPVFVGVSAMSLNVLLSILFSRLFNAIGWMPHGGLALANSLATFLEALTLLFFMRRRLSGLEGRLLLNGTLKALLAGAIMSAVLAGWMQVMQGAGSWLVTLGGMAIGVLVYVIGLWLLRTPELAKVIGFLRRKIAPVSKGTAS
jgi:putative peptidoglycan lipid II flippase